MTDAASRLLYRESRNFPERESNPMKTVISLSLIYLLLFATAQAQSPPATATAADSIQVSQTDRAAEPKLRELNIRAGTPLEIEAAFTVNSYDAKRNDLLSFRVLVPVKVDDEVVIEQDALVTGRVVEAKRGGHWGKAGKLAWVMQDVVAVDLTRVPLTVNAELPAGQQRITGTSHGGQVAAQVAIAAPLMLFAAPVALMAGFKRGENAVLPEGKRFIVSVQNDTLVHVK